MVFQSLLSVFMGMRHASGEGTHRSKVFKGCRASPKIRV